MHLHFSLGVKLQAALAASIDKYVLVVVDLTRENPAGQRSFHFPLQGALERAGTIHGIVAGAYQVGTRAVRQFNLNMPLGEALAQTYELNFDDLLEMLF